MDTTGLQRDPARPTGTVEVRLDRRDAPEFRIPADQAWDAVEARPAIEAAATLPDAPPVLYHGTLALRTPRGLATLDALRSQTGARIFVDVNLRAPWWDPSSVRTQLAQATWSKMNEDELVELTGDRAGTGTDAARASWLASRAELEILWVTRGAAGAVACLRQGSTLAAPAARARPLVDTVGTGDAFSAVAILGLLDGWDVETTLRRAVELAAELCRHRGAIPDDPTFYEEARRRWKDDR
jgi:fructokinase